MLKLLLVIYILIEHIVSMCKYYLKGSHDASFKFIKFRFALTQILPLAVHPPEDL